MRKMSRGMSQRKLPGGHSASNSSTSSASAQGGGEDGVARFSLGASLPTLTVSSAARESSATSLLTFLLLHLDGGIGENTGVSLQCVVVGAVILLILEGAVLIGLLCKQIWNTIIRLWSPGLAPPGHA